MYVMRGKLCYVCALSMVLWYCGLFADLFRQFIGEVRQLPCFDVLGKFGAVNALRGYYGFIGC